MPLFLYFIQKTYNFYTVINTKMTEKMKLLIIGELNIGKTSLVNPFCSKNSAKNLQQIVVIININIAKNYNTS